MKNSLLAVFSIFVLLFASAEAGAQSALSMKGRLLRPDGTPVTANAVQFRVQIRTPTPSSCLLFEETHTLDLSQKAGFFSFNLNDGTASVANTEPFPVDRIFRNGQQFSFTTGKCASGSSYAPAATDSRVIAIAFNDGTFAGWETLPSRTITATPHSFESYSVGGFKSSELFRVLDLGGAPVTLSAWPEADYQKLLDIVSNVSVVGGNVNVGGSSAGFSGALAGDVTGAQGGTVVGRLRGREIANTTPADGQVLTWNQGLNRWAPMAVPGGLPAGPAGGDLAGFYPNPTLTNNSVTTTKIDDAAVTTAKIMDGSVTEYKLSADVQSRMWSSLGGATLNYPGSVGIGTSTPSRNLDVLGSARVRGSTELFPAANGDPVLRFGDAGANERWQIRLNNGFEIHDVVNGYTRFYLNQASGMTVIGDSTLPPVAPLTIESRGVTSNQLALVSPRQTLTVGHWIGGIDFVSNNTGLPAPGLPAARVQAIASGIHSVSSLPTDLSFQVTSPGSTTLTEGLRIHSNGRVGIGTSTPEATLDVNGYVKLVRYPSPPIACLSGAEGTIALTNSYRTCVCNGSAWVSTADGTTACIW